MTIHLETFLMQANNNRIAVYFGQDIAETQFMFFWGENGCGLSSHLSELYDESTNMGLKVVCPAKSIVNTFDFLSYAMTIRVGPIVSSLEKIYRDSLTKYWAEKALSIYLQSDSPAISYLKMPKSYKYMVDMVFTIALRLCNAGDLDYRNVIISENELFGIVFIDDVFSNLSTKSQKLFLNSLEKLFPNVQFFLSTHGEVPNYLRSIKAFRL